MKRQFVVTAGNTVSLYRNNRNANKYIEVKKADDGHSYVRQYMSWDTPEGTVKNYNGSADAKRGRYHRANKQTINQILQDYSPVTASTSGDNLRDALSEYVMDALVERLDNIAIEIASEIPEYDPDYCADGSVLESEQYEALSALVDAVVYSLTYDAPDRESIGY